MKILVRMHVKAELDDYQTSVNCHIGQYSLRYVLVLSEE